MTAFFLVIYHASLIGRRSIGSEPNQRRENTLLAVCGPSCLCVSHVIDSTELQPACGASMSKHRACCCHMYRSCARTLHWPYESRRATGGLARSCHAVTIIPVCLQQQQAFYGNLQQSTSARFSTACSLSNPPCTTAAILPGVGTSSRVSEATPPAPRAVVAETCRHPSSHAHAEARHFGQIHITTAVGAVYEPATRCLRIAFAAVRRATKACF